MNDAEITLAGAIDTLSRKAVVQRLTFIAQRIKLRANNVSGRQAIKVISPEGGWLLDAGGRYAVSTSHSRLAVYRG